MYCVDCGSVDRVSDRSERVLGAPRLAGFKVREPWLARAADWIDLWGGILVHASVQTTQAPIVACVCDLHCELPLQ
jgi:hypothetical protein